MRLAVEAELLGQEQDHGALGALAVLVDARLEQDRAVELHVDHGGAEIRALGAEADAAVAHGQADAVEVVLARAARRARRASPRSRSRPARGRGPRTG